MVLQPRHHGACEIADRVYSFGMTDMKKSTSFRDYIIDLLSGVLDVTTRSMFSGWGFYQRGVIFGFAVESEFYVKGAVVDKDDFMAAGSRQFTYLHTNKKMVSMPYWFVPEDILENRDEFARWVSRAIATSKAKKK